MVEIIPTFSINDVENYKKILNEYSKLDIDKIRINMTRHEPEFYVKEISVIKEIYRNITNGKKLRILLDIPFPGTKSRIEFDGESHFITLNEREELFISRNKDDMDIRRKIIFVENSADLFTAKINDKVFIDDGRVKLIVVSNDGRMMKLSSLNSGKAIYKKSINREGAIYFQEERVDYINNLMLAIKEISPESLALSFIENDKQLEQFKCLLKKNEVNDQILLIPKLETPTSSENISHIISSCKTVMIGRGDLGLTGNICNLPFYQQNILDACRKSKIDVIVATDILNSVTTTSIPNRAELIDVFSLVQNNVSRFVTSGPVGLGEGLEEFCKVVREIYDLYHSNTTT